MKRKYESHIIEKDEAFALMEKFGCGDEHWCLRKDRYRFVDLVKIIVEIMESRSYRLGQRDERALVKGTFSRALRYITGEEIE